MGLFRMGNLLLAKSAGPGIVQRLKNTGVDFVEITKASEKAVRKGTDFLKKVINRDRSCGVDVNQSRGWMLDLYKNAAGIRVLYAMKKENESVAKQAFQKVLRLVTNDNTSFTQAGGEEFFAFHLITETMLQKGGEDWEKWFPVVRDKLIDVQNQDGSWTGHHCITSRTFCTAAAILVLTAPNRFLPISQS